ncbi:site-specific integrase [Thetidibacter halocola]|uniref:Site-specific integrase n=1 Tax=Thetidibacter halocola TaxID=2827239 RepID=A0A8J7WK11_9RHOB|nr:site-specific integrase [Thetidibacter halocola]MBS0126656.1 site-specific integrase [Thetidibacter halocola]
MTVTSKESYTDLRRLKRGLSIFKRGRSPFWYARAYDTKTKKYHFRSTEETSRVKAEQEAWEFLTELKSGAIAQPELKKEHSFEHYAKMLYDQAVLEGKANTIKDRNKILHRPEDGLVAYFGNWDVRAINTGHFREYLIHLDKRRDKPLANGTKQKQILMARQVLHLAMEDGLITSVPAVPKLELKDKPRPSFSDAEYKKFITTIKQQGRDRETAEGTVVTPEFVRMLQFMVHTFLRPTESELYGLRHKNVELHETPNNHLRLYIKGKTGARVAVSMPLAVVLYTSQQLLYPDASSEDFVFFPQIKDRSNLVKRTGHVFNHTAETCGLKLDQYGQPRTPYSFRHYALQARLRSSKGLVNIHSLAKNAGTSVAMLQRFYLKNMELSDDLIENLQIHSMDEYRTKKREKSEEDEE